MTKNQIEFKENSKRIHEEFKKTSKELQEVEHKPQAGIVGCASVSKVSHAANDSAVVCNDGIHDDADLTQPDQPKHQLPIQEPIDTSNDISSSKVDHSLPGSSRWFRGGRVS